MGKVRIDREAIKGIIFDFNGTMFQDSDLHEAAWVKMIKHYAQGSISEAEILKDVHGRTNDEIIRRFIAADLPVEEVAALGAEKEAYYRKLCLRDKQRLALTAGLPHFLNQLKMIKMPITIATATTKENVDFYFEQFHLGQWFQYAQVVYDDGTFPGKPAPDIFIKAANILEIPRDVCLVFEDSYSGLTAASKAGIGTLIAVDNTGNLKQVFPDSPLSVAATISDFRTIEIA
jgi:beta-phosphoglucomutase